MGKVALKFLQNLVQNWPRELPFIGFRK